MRRNVTRNKKERWLQLEDFSFGDFVFNCQKGGPRFLSVLQGENGSGLSHKKNKLYLVETQCCLTFYYLHVMIYEHTLSI